MPHDDYTPGNEEASYPPHRHTENNGVPDGYSDRRAELDSPASHAFPITPGQTELPTTIRGLYIGTSGNVFCRTLGGNTSHTKANVFFYNVVAGTVLPIRMDGVWDYNSTEADITQNTTATFLVGLY